MTSPWLTTQLVPARAMIGGVGTGAPVGDSEDLRRVLALPRRPPPDLDGPEGEALADIMTERLRRDNPACKCASWGRPCLTRLKPVQAWVLYEAPLAGGAFGACGVGSGKTGIDILVAMVMPCAKVVLLLPPGRTEQLLADYLAWGEHFKVPSLIMQDASNKGFLQPGRPAVHVVTYSKLSRPKSTDLLDKLAPDGVVADEAHRLKDCGCATCKRLLRYAMTGNLDWFVPLSGSPMSDSVTEATHLMALSLGDGSPLPLDPVVADEWASALDPSPLPAAPGRLAALGEPVREGFRRRLTETRGVIVYAESDVTASLNLDERVPPEIPVKVAEGLASARSSVRPDGEVLLEQVQVAECAHQLSSGFYYRWKFPRGESEQLIDEWFAARKLWHRELRGKLLGGDVHLDSPHLCTVAAIRYHRGDQPREGAPTWAAEHWPRWARVKDLVEPEEDVQWIDDWLARDAADWATSGDRHRGGRYRGVVWYLHKAWGERVAELLGVQACGLNSEKRIRAEKGDRPVVASIHAHGTGLDGLQFRFDHALVGNNPAGSTRWEQLCGRHHRPGLAFDEVNFDVYRHTAEYRRALDSAVRKAKFVRDVVGGCPKLLAASCGFQLDPDADADEREIGP